MEAYEEDNADLKGEGDTSLIAYVKRFRTEEKSRDEICTPRVDTALSSINCFIPISLEKKAFNYCAQLNN